MTLKNLYFLIFIPLILLSCEDVITVDLPESEPRLVIEGTYDYTENTLRSDYVKLSLNSPFFDEEIQPVLDANVKIIDQTNNLIYDLHDEENKGVYRSPTFRPDFDTNYILEVTYNNEVYRSTPEQLIPTVPIDKLETGDGTLFEGNEKEVIITLTDDGSRDDYYLFRFASNLYLTSEDKFYQGSEFRFSYFYDDTFDGSEVMVNIFGIDKRYYNYMTIIIEQTDDRGNPFGTASVNAKGNIVNLTNQDHYPLGYFRLAETYQKSIVLDQ